MAGRSASKNKQKIEMPINLNLSLCDKHSDTSSSVRSVVDIVLERGVTTLGKVRHNFFLF